MRVLKMEQDRIDCRSLPPALSYHLGEAALLAQLSDLAIVKRAYYRTLGYLDDFHYKEDDQRSRFYVLGLAAGLADRLNLESEQGAQETDCQLDEVRKAFSERHLDDLLRLCRILLHADLAHLVDQLVGLAGTSRHADIINGELESYRSKQD